MNSKVSILIPVMNEEMHILECIDSVLNQSHSNLEVLVVDDFSEDRTFDLVRSIKDARLRVLKNKNKGKVNAFNMAYSVSTGDYIVYLGGDDILPVDSIEKRLAHIAKQGKDDKQCAAFGQLLMFSEDSTYNNIRIPANGSNGHISGGTLIMNRKLAEQVFPIPNSLPNEDTWTRLCIENLADIVSDVPFVVLKYRIHSANSHRRSMLFSEMNEFLHKRYSALSLFYNMYASDLSQKKRNLLESAIEVEELRYSGAWLVLLYKSMLGDFKVLSSLFSCNSFFYSLKNKFYWVKRIKFQ